MRGRVINDESIQNDNCQEITEATLEQSQCTIEKELKKKKRRYLKQLYPDYANASLQK